MNSRLGVLGLVGWLVLTVEAALPRPVVAAERGEFEPSPILVRIDFEDEAPSGPDSFRLFERPSGRVELSEAFRVSGSQSLRLQEGRGDGSFSEFLGSIPLRRQGPLLVRFYILFADPSETFNFALAGPRWFKSFEKDGHAFWLATEGGKLLHHPASGWRELFAPKPFTWYLVDLLFDLDGGTYDLSIYEEGLKEPRVDVRRQRNSCDADGSAISFYSFIGDLDDRGEAIFFVDDVWVATDPAVSLAPFVAPGRRSFFFERLGWPPAEERLRDSLLSEGRAFLRSNPAERPVLTTAAADRLEQAAGEAFYAGDLDLARELLERLLAEPARAERVLLKLADVYHLRGWVEEERSARERIYGRLRLGQ